MKKALVVGIDSYLQSPLNGCVNDAEAVTSLLEHNEDGSTNFSVTKLINVQKRGDLKRNIRDCFQGNDEIALFYFSGHGFIDSFGGYLVTPDCQQDDVGISMCEILEMINQSKCENKVVILDCCKSGMMGSVSTTNQTTVIQEGVSILTACRSDEVAIEMGGQGVFTSLLIEALKGGAADIIGNISTGGIYAFIDKALGPLDQRPIFKTNVSRFSPIRKAKPQIASEILHKIIKYFPLPSHEFALDPTFEYTNTPDSGHNHKEPYAIKENTAILQDLQKMVSVGLVKPCNADHMYYAAMDSKSCKLTSIGQHYWYLVDKKII